MRLPQRLRATHLWQRWRCTVPGISTATLWKVVTSTSAAKPTAFSPATVAAATSGVLRVLHDGRYRALRRRGRRYGVASTGML